MSRLPSEPGVRSMSPFRPAGRTVAATVVLFLERIRQDAGPHPIAVWEQLGR